MRNTEYPSGLSIQVMVAAVAEPDSREGHLISPRFYAQIKKQTVQSNPMGLYMQCWPLLTKYTVKGILWYQVHLTGARAYQYRNLFRALIVEYWRQKFTTRGNMPFIVVQLPKYDPCSDVPKESATAELRESQLWALSLTHTKLGRNNRNHTKCRCFIQRKKNRRHPGYPCRSKLDSMEKK